MADGGENGDGGATLDCVKLDGLVVLKIVKHCKESLPALVTGQLLGLDFQRDDASTLEVTNCFPFPSRSEDVEGNVEDDGADYQIAMMRCLREVNVDNNTVGWYQSTYLGSFLNETMIETQFNYQDHIKNGVCIVYDPLKTQQGSLSLRAIRLTPSFMDMYRAGSFSADQLAKAELTSSDIFQEVPIRLHNTALIRALLYDYDSTMKLSTDFDRLNLTTNPFLEKNLEFLIECIDDLGVELNKFQYHQRNVQRIRQQQDAFLAKRKQENQSRRLHGQDLLPDEDTTNHPLFKPVQEPSRLEALLITNQVNQYCQQINTFAGQSFSKLFLLGGLHNKV
jgi:translation initiation factor 3 subunit H